MEATQENMKALMRRLDEERKALGMSLADVGFRCGVERSTVSKMMGGTYPAGITLKTLQRVAKVFGYAVHVALERAETCVAEEKLEVENE